jgi:hypothetical protein
LNIEKNGENAMLNILAVILIVLWLFGFFTSYTMGGAIHALFILAVILFLVRIIMGRKVT